MLEVILDVQAIGLERLTLYAVVFAVVMTFKQEAAIGVLSHDPRPSYQRKPDRIYGLTFAGYDLRFKVNEDILTVVEVNKV